MAEALCRQVVSQRKTFPYKIESAGTTALLSQPASEAAVAVLRRKKIDLSVHRSRPLTQELAAHVRAMFVMTHFHREWVQAHIETISPGDVYLFGDAQFLPAAVEIHDPIGEGDSGYGSVVRQMEEILPSLVHFIETRL